MHMNSFRLRAPMETKLSGQSIQAILIELKAHAVEEAVIFYKHSAWNLNESQGGCECKQEREKEMTPPTASNKTRSWDKAGTRDRPQPWTGGCWVISITRTHPGSQIVGVCAFHFCLWVWEREEHENRDLIGRHPRDCLPAKKGVTRLCHICVSV